MPTKYAKPSRRFKKNGIYLGGGGLFCRI